MNTVILHHSDEITIWQHHLCANMVVLTFNEEGNYDRLEMDKTEAMRWIATAYFAKDFVAKNERIEFIKEVLRPQSVCAVAAVLEERQTEVNLPEFMDNSLFSHQQRVARAIIPVPETPVKKHPIRRLVESLHENLGRLLACPDFH